MIYIEDEASAGGNGITRGLEAHRGGRGNGVALEGGGGEGGRVMEGGNGGRGGVRVRHELILGWAVRPMAVGEAGYWNGRDGRSYTQMGAVRTLLTGRPTCLRRDGACFDDGTDMDRRTEDRDKGRGSSAALKERKQERTDK